MRRYLLVLFVIPLLILSSCKKDVDEPLVNLTDDELARDYLYAKMNSYYLWYKLMPVVVKEDYPDPYKLLNALRYKELDKWSSIQTYDQYNAFNQASFVGHGISIGLDNSNKARIAMIFNKSPMYEKGVRRGWIIKKLNGTDLAPIILSRDKAAYQALIGPSEAGVTNTFLFEMPDGRDYTITTTKSTFTTNTVLHYDTLKLKSGVTGHLVYDQFLIPPSNTELLDAFSYFKQNNVKDIIVDLRYNGGGYFDVLAKVASYIAGSSKFGKPFLSVKYNDKHSEDNDTFVFPSVTAPLSITKVVIISTRSTASASEQLINGLRPFMEVKCIGDTTLGKPVGMDQYKYNTKYVFWPVTIRVVNSKNEADFYDGFPPEKYVPDDITHDFNDRNELCLREAIYYLENGTISTKRTYEYHRQVTFPEKSSRPNEALLIQN